MVKPSPDSSPIARLISQTRQERYLAYRQAHHEKRLATRRRILRWAIRFGYWRLQPGFAPPGLGPPHPHPRGPRKSPPATYSSTPPAARQDSPVDIAAIEPVMAVQVFPEGKSDNEPT